MQDASRFELYSDRLHLANGPCCTYGQSRARSESSCVTLVGIFTFKDLKTYCRQSCIFGGRACPVLKKTATVSFQSQLLRQAERSQGSLKREGTGEYRRNMRGFETSIPWYCTNSQVRLPSWETVSVFSTRLSPSHSLHRISVL